MDVPLCLKRNVRKSETDHGNRNHEACIYRTVARVIIQKETCESWKIRLGVSLREKQSMTPKIELNVKTTAQFKHIMRSYLPFVFPMSDFSCLTLTEFSLHV